jgi:hypothetical protein
MAKMSDFEAKTRFGELLHRVERSEENSHHPARPSRRARGA